MTRRLFLFTLVFAAAFFGAGNRVVNRGAALEPETILWQSRVAAAGGTLAGDSLAIANNLVVALKAEAYYSKIKWLLPLLGSNLAAARVPLIDVLNVGIATNVACVDADFSQSTGLQFNGTTKKLDSLIKFSQVGTSNNAGAGYWERNINATGLQVMTSTGGSEIFGLLLRTTSEIFYYGDGSSPATAGAPAGGNHFYYGQRDSSTHRILYRNASNIAESGNAASVSEVASGNVYVGGRNDAVFALSRCGVALLTDGTLSSTDVSSLYSILNTGIIAATGR